jgi:hypothetical protein
MRKKSPPERRMATENLTLPSPWKGEAAYCDLAPHKAHS